MGKYIVELESGTHIFVLGPEGIVHIGEPDVVYETVDGMQIGDAVINAKPYTEPDLEQVRIEAYQEGYRRALADVREEQVCQTCVYFERDENEEPCVRCPRNFLDQYTPKQELDGELKVGDEVVFGNDEEIKAVVIDEADEAGVWLLLSENGCVERMDGVLFHRTGRHFSELTSIFEKMREE